MAAGRLACGIAITVVSPWMAKKMTRIIVFKLFVPCEPLFDIAASLLFYQKAVPLKEKVDENLFHENKKLFFLKGIMRLTKMKTRS